MWPRGPRATRSRPTCPPAIRRARPTSSGSWPPGAISPAMNATSALTSGSYITATLRPCLRAFCAERALPAAEVGPVPAGLPRRVGRRLRLLIPGLISAPPAASGAVTRCPGRRPPTRRRWPPPRGAGPARRLIGAGDMGGNPLQDHVVIGFVLAVDQRPRPEQRAAGRAGGRGG